MTMARQLTDEEFGCVQTFCEGITDEILRLGLSVHIETDFRAFARLRKSVGDGFCYPSFDPDRCTIGPRDFWLRAVDDAGATVSAYATRIFEDVGDFYQLVRSERLWHDRGLNAVKGCEPICSIPAFGGLVGHDGGMWVEPPHRGRGLARLLPGLSRGLQLRNHAVDFDTGLVFEPLCGLARAQYQYARVELMVDGYFPPTGKPERVFLCHISRDEALASVGFSAVDDSKSRVAA